MCVNLREECKRVIYKKMKILSIIYLVPAIFLVLICSYKQHSVLIARSNLKPQHLSYSNFDIMAMKRCQQSTFYVCIKLRFGWQCAHCKTYTIPIGMINRAFSKEDFIHFCCNLVINLVYNLIYQFLIYKRDASGLLWVLSRHISLSSERSYPAVGVAPPLLLHSPSQDWGLKL